MEKKEDKRKKIIIMKQTKKRWGKDVI